MEFLHCMIELFGIFWLTIGCVEMKFTSFYRWIYH